jgi:hypothetical protein
MRIARLTPVSAVAAACAGAAAWLTLGTLTVTEGSARASRVGLLPPAWWLLALVAAAVALAWLARLSPDRARPLFFSAALGVPWLPVPLPPAMLACTGPISWLVWAAIGGAMLGARTTSEGKHPPWRAVLRDARRAPWIAFACAALVFGTAAWRLAPLVPGGDEPHYLVIAQSLWRDGDLKIENNHQRGDYLEYYGGSLKPDYLARGKDGQIYSIHLPGVPALVAPVLAAGGYRLVQAMLLLLAAGATAMAWRTAFLLTGSAEAAWFGWAGAALTAPFLLLSFTVYPDGPGAVIVLLAFAAIVRLDASPRRTAWQWLALGVLPALLPWLHPRFAVLAAALGLVFAARALRDTRPVAALGAFAAVPVASAVAWFSYYYAIYGRLDPAAAYGHYTQMSIGRIPTGILGLLFDQQYGLIASAPIFAVGIAGVAPLVRRHRRLAIEWLIIVLPYALVTAMYQMWWGGYSSPARFIGATLLLYSLPLAAAWSSARHATTRSLQAVTLALSAAIAVMLVTAEGGAFVFDARHAVAPWLVWAGQIADLAHGAPGLLRAARPWTALAEVGVWTAALCLAWLAARSAERERRVQTGTAALVLLCAMGLAAWAALASVWRIEGVDGILATTGQLRAVNAAASGRAARGLTFAPFTITSTGAAIGRVRLGLERVNGLPEGTLVWLPSLPAGRYRLWIDAPAGGQPFDASLLVGRRAGPIESWRFEPLPPGASSREFDLPVAVSSVAVWGSASANASVRAAWLQPSAGANSAGSLSRLHATEARRLGRVAVFAVKNVYLEPGGLWTAGTEAAEVVIRTDPGDAQAGFTMKSGSVATSVDVSAGSFSTRAALAAGESRDLFIPVAPGEPALLHIRAGQGFRPSSVDHSSSDTRLLGVRLEPRQE